MYEFQNNGNNKGDEHIMAVVEHESRDSMKERLTIRKRGQVTLPKALIDRYGLEEGDTLELIEEGGELKVVPMVQVPAAQKWFWTEEWQEGEREAEQEIKAGDVATFNNLDDLFADLNDEED